MNPPAQMLIGAACDRGVSPALPERSPELQTPIGKFSSQCGTNATILDAPFS
jgi:hypothetical protein